MKPLFKTNANAINRVYDKLKLSQTMTHRQVILGDTNTDKLNEVKKLLYKAIEILNTIE